MTEVKLTLVCKRKWWFKIAWVPSYWLTALGLVSTDKVARWFAVHAFHKLFRETHTVERETQ